MTVHYRVHNQAALPLLCITILDRLLAELPAASRADVLTSVAQSLAKRDGGTAKAALEILSESKLGESK